MPNCPYIITENGPREFPIRYAYGFETKKFRFELKNLDVIYFEKIGGFGDGFIINDSSYDSTCIYSNDEVSENIILTKPYRIEITSSHFHKVYTLSTSDDGNSRQILEFSKFLDYCLGRK